MRAETLAAGEQRFFLLETIREFALEQLVAAGEWDQLHQRHYHIYLERFRTVDEHLRGPDGPTWFARLQPEHDNLRAAMQWTLDGARYEETAWLILATVWYCRLRGHWYEELDWIQATLPHRRDFAPELRLTLLNIFYSVARALEEFEIVNRYTSELIELAERSSAKVLCAGSWHFVAIATPDFTQAAAAWEKSLALLRAARESPALGREFGVCADYLFVLSATTENYAIRLIDHGQFAHAESLIRESLHACEVRGFRGGIGACLGALGRLALLQGELSQASILLQQAMTAVATGIHATVLARTQSLLALVTLYYDNPEEARRLLLESLAVWRNIRDKLYLTRVSIYLAETALWEGDVSEAERWLTQGLNYQVDPRWIGTALVNCLFVAARLAVARQHFRRAATLLGLAEATRVRTHCTLVEPVRAQVDAAMTTVRAALEPAPFAEAFAAGQQLTPAEAFVTALIAYPTIISQPE